MTLHATLHRAWAADLTPAQLYDLLRLRTDIFVVEQKCPYPELDGRDLEPGTRHFWLADDEGRVLATLRLLEDSGGEFRIGRVCTAANARGNGLSGRLMEAVVAEVGSAPSVLDAQVEVKAFYARYGYVEQGEEFVEDGIPHITMRRSG
ncbi:GNAT family N-acetyltransferase [Kutzneria sp. CA-103260]|uniref:GNAT family N-acetyltransferase n=1 Tax=Kutzneria sp. CA-103260 TaxID=2802641 RepID=UPI001BA5FD17|nr:GNAT family N-acetyltransferase [Kutzneria sp. CA-103260]QUQ71566.1 ElaA protein [Kutzneria sp. CA-103260]